MKKVVKIDVPNLQSASDILTIRSLNKSFPQLKRYLKPGLRVLDVGCGLGTITYGVAEAVENGEVVGIDPVEAFVDQASQQAIKLRLKNVSFALGDAHFLDFPDEAFDLTYSHHSLQYCIDPVKALQEQKRVTKKGGWVAAKVGDGGVSLKHPPCPTVIEVLDAREQYAEYLSAHYKPGEHIRGLFCRPYGGRRCLEWFTEAGLIDVIIEVGVESVEYPGADYFSEGIPMDFRIDGVFSEYFIGMIEAGFLDEGTLDQAGKEIQAWYSQPYAFFFRGSVLAFGKA